MSEAVIRSKLTADTTGFESGMNRAGAKAEGFKAGMAKVGNAIKAAFAVAAIQQFASSITDALTAAENKMDAMGDFAFETGLSPENAQALTVMAEQYGVGADKLAMMIAKLKEAQGEISGTSDEAAALQLQFFGLGMSVEQVQRATSGDLFVSMLEQLAQAEGDAEKAKKIMELIGATGAKGGRMQQFLKAAGGGGLEETKAVLSAAGAQVTEKDLTAADVATNNAIIQQQLDMVRSSRTRIFQPVAGTAAGDFAAVGKDVMTLNVSGLMAKGAQAIAAAGAAIKGDGSKKMDEQTRVLQGIEKNTAAGARL